MSNVQIFLIALGVMLLCYSIIIVLSITGVLDWNNKKIIAKCKAEGSYATAIMCKQNYHADTDDRNHSFWVMYFKYTVGGIVYKKRIINDELLDCEYVFYYKKSNPKKIYNIGDGKRPLRVLLTFAPIAMFIFVFALLYNIK